jgi:hypothetical protein
VAAIFKREKKARDVNRMLSVWKRYSGKLMDAIEHRILRNDTIMRELDLHSVQNKTEESSKIE